MSGTVSGSLHSRSVKRSNLLRLFNEDSATRISGGLFAAAKAAGEIQGRSAAQQLDHWARIGRALELAPMVTRSLIERVLNGQLSYDAASGLEQAAVRAAWDERVLAKIADLNFEDRKTEVGLTWAESDAEGRVVVRDQALESWLREEVVSAYDELVADPSAAVGIDEVRARLSAKYSA